MMSRIVFWAGALLILVTAFFYYPKWQQPQTEATLSWDVSGYYLYLPAIFIYGDLNKVAFLEEVVKKYNPAPGTDQVFEHNSGSRVMKYSSGQALQFLPWFLAAHSVADMAGYPSDGFSPPYQAAISWGSILVALLGIWLSRINLLTYFSDRVTAFALAGLVFATNYLNYTAIDGAMTHNWLFTAYSLLIFLTIRFFQNPTILKSAAIGGLIGWMILTRPTEIMAVIIPAMWGGLGLADRIQFGKKHAGKIGIAVLAASIIIFIQPAYWKYVSGDWLIYSYKDQGFSWLNPHIIDVLVSYKAGWWVYTPFMFLGVVGLIPLFRRRELFWPVAIFALVQLYVTSAWDIWWYGGSLGQRALIQGYAVWLFALAAACEWLLKRRFFTVFLVLGLIICTIHNFWWTHQAHRGGQFLVERMDKKTYWEVLGVPTPAEEPVSTVDAPDIFQEGERNNVLELLATGFETDSIKITDQNPIYGTKSLVIGGAIEYSPVFEFTPGENAKWIRASVTYGCVDACETEIWKMTQFTVRFTLNGELIRDRTLRLQNLDASSGKVQVVFDTKIPKTPFDKAMVLFWNPGSEKTILLDDLKIESFR